MNDAELPAAHRAIRLFKQGKLHPREMLEQLVAGKVVVPTTEMPRIEDNRIAGWRPATASKADGSLWLLAFTTKQLASAFCDNEPHFGFYFDVDTRWVLGALPANCGIAFNLRSADQFEWSAAGLAKYMHDVLGVDAPGT
jgi:hypothetical protein